MQAFLGRAESCGEVPPTDSTHPPYYMIRIEELVLV